VESRLALTIGRKSSGAKVPIREALKIARLRRASAGWTGSSCAGRSSRPRTPTVFQDDPVRLIRVFRHCQQLDCTLDFHLAQLIRESLPLMANICPRPTPPWPSGPSCPSRGPSTPSSAMHELGSSGRFIPEFDALTCLVQHEFYHRYTADYHTLNAIRSST
jgi:[protein-PII] uridylyltransferase